VKFRYLALDNKGARGNGTVDATDLRAATMALRDMGLVPVKIAEAGKGIDFTNLSFGQAKATGKDVTNFTRQLATMITAGLPLTDALNLLKLQSPPAVAGVVTAILADVQGGVALSEAMSKHSDVFSTVYVSLVKAGEAAGVVETVLNRLAENLEKSREFTGKVKGAMVYPGIVLVGMVGVMALMMLFVVPKISSLYKEFDAALPFSTQIVIGISNFMINFWWIVIAMVVGAIFGVRAFFRHPDGRAWWDGISYKVPIMGPLSKNMMITELTRTMSLLIGSGVSIVDALNIAAGGTGNVIVERSVKGIARQVERGFPVSISFSESTAFPPIIGQILAVGEETGKMDEVLAKLSKYFETDAEEKVKGLTSAIEPLIIILLAVGVGFLMFAIIMPIYSITDKI
jgi:type IV pilus assembly protein PilC